VGNAGQLMAIDNNSTINGSAESAAYTYDNLARLATSSQTSNGSSAQRRFEYDRWGNRTGIWDATSGGNQIQSVTLQQSGGAPTNRIQTVYPPKVNFALAANGSTATASSTLSAAYAASATINGDRKGTGWGETGGGWNDATANTYPDWLQVTFNGSKTIDEIDVFTLQDNFSNPSEPTESMTFTQYGIVDFQVQYWNGLSWQTVSGGSITGNNKVWKKVSFSQITTSKIRVNVTNALSSYSRLTEVEAWGPAPGISITYDAAGNVTNDSVHTYTYDAEKRVVSVDSGNTASYSYDYQNRRYKKSIGTTVTHYIWQGGQVLAEHNGSTGAVQMDYIYSGSRLIAKVSSGSTQYFLSDRLSTRLVVDASGNVPGRMAHLPYGEDFGESGTQEKHHFTSYERDAEDGADYAISRYSNETLGRFTSIDPKASSAKKELPQSWNRYTYSMSDPINRKDPSGTAPSSNWNPFLPGGDWDQESDPCGDVFEDWQGGGEMTDPICIAGEFLWAFPEPQDMNPSCGITFDTEGTPMGRGIFAYPSRSRKFIDPDTSDLGKGNTDLELFFFYEVVVGMHLPMVNDVASWTAYQRVTRSVIDLLVLDTGTIVPDFGFQRQLTRDPDGPELDNVVKVPFYYEGTMLWLDTPSAPNGYAGRQIVSGKVEWNFYYEARYKGKKVCSRSLTLLLTYKDGIGTWNVFQGPPGN
jgi:RHS repeat-associated protein